MKSIYIYISLLFTVLLASSCMEEKVYPEAIDVTSEYKPMIQGVWEPIEQSVYYYTKSYVPGKDTVVVFKSEDFLNAQSDYFNSDFYSFKITVAELKDGNPQLINLNLNNDLSYSFGENTLPGASYYVTKMDGIPLINFVKMENESSDIKLIDRMPYTIISLTESELVVGTKCDSQESVFVGGYNITTGNPDKQNRWCSHTIKYKKK